MILIVSIAAAAALIVVAYQQLLRRDPDTANTVLRAVRELAAIVLVCSRAVEGVVDALQYSAQPQPTGAAGGAWRPAARPLVESWEFDDDEQ